MKPTCPECGATLPQGTTCQAIFDLFLNLEYSDPEYGQVHLLTVACFMIQHGRYSDEALRWMEQQLRLVLDEGLPVERIRQQAAREMSQGKRAWQVTRQPGAPPLPQIAWSMTIADVAANYQDARTYRALVQRWARATLAEMQPLLSAQP